MRGTATGKYLFAFMALWVWGGIAFGQDPQFSQFYASPLYLNPALTGLEKDVYFGLNYRSQWNSTQSPYRTGQFSFIHPVLLTGSEYRHIGGVGLSAYQDLSGVNGEFKATGVYFSGAYNVSISDNHLVSMGLQAGFVQKSIDLRNLRWGSQYDEFIGYNSQIIPSVGDIREKNAFPVFNAGFIWHYEKQSQRFLRTKFRSFLGFAVSNLNRPDESLLQDESSRLPWLYKLHGGTEFTLSPVFKISPNFLLMRQNEVRQYNVGTYLTVTKGGHRYSARAKTLDVQLGGWYRLHDSFIGMIGIGMDNVAAGFSYDMNASNLQYGNLIRGTYEISVSYRIIKGKGVTRFSTPLM